MSDGFAVTLDVTPLSILLLILATYHVVMGAIALFAPARAARAAGALYGARLGDTAALRYATSMIGTLALVVGGLAAVAAVHPNENRPIIGALLALQLGRLFCRVRDHRLLADSLGVAPRRNGAMVAVLGVEVLILTLGLR